MPEPTQKHQIVLSDDAYHLLVMAFGMWSGVELSDFDIRSEQQGMKTYATFKAWFHKEFGTNPVNGKFAAALTEIQSQLKPRS